MLIKRVLSRIRAACHFAVRPFGGPVEVFPVGLMLALAWLVPAAAFAYPGEAILNFGAQYIIGPLGIFAIVICLAAALFQPQFARGALMFFMPCPRGKQPNGTVTRDAAAPTIAETRCATPAPCRHRHPRRFPRDTPRTL